MESNELIIVKQTPVIEEQLKQVSEQVEKKVKEALSLVCNEETVKTVKDVRASLNKELKEFETKRKQIKEEVMKPYEEFEKKYKEYISDKYKLADNDLKSKIESVENELKEEKKKEVKKYFDEYLVNKGIDFVTFENANINITLTASMKSLKEQSKDFIDKISNDLAIIEMQEHKEEILVEYKKSLNATQAIITVGDRLKAIEEEKAKQEIKRVPTIEEVEQVKFEPNEFKIVPVKKEFTIKFNLADGELEKIISFLEKSGIEYKMEGI